MMMQALPQIPYFQTSRYRVEAMIDLSDPKPHEKGVDLGSGDGRILIAFAKKGVLMMGFETDEKLLELSIANYKKENLTNVSIENTDFWQADLSVFDIITIYPMPDVLETLEEKVKKELRPASRLLVNFYPLPTLQPSKIKDNIYLYNM